MAGKQLVNNSIIGVIQLILTAILTLLSVPIFIHKLGMELYGIFAIVSVIGNLNLLTNFGLNGALLVYIAKQGKCRESDHDIVVTQIIMVILTVTFTLLAVIFSDFIINDVFKIPVQYNTESKKLLIFLVFANSILLVGQTYTAIIDANQKIYISNICQFIYSIIYWGGMIISVSLGGNLTTIGLIALGSAIIWFFTVMYFSRRIWGKLEINGVLRNFKRIAKKQLSYGSKIYLSGLAGFMFEPLSKILLSNFIGLNAVAFFEIGSKIRSQLNGLVTKALYPIYPYIANTPKSEVLHKKLFDFSKKIQLIVIPISLIVSFILTYVLKVWLGSQNLTQTSIFAITMTTSMLLLSPPSLLIYQYLAAKNMADKNLWIQLSSAVVNVVVFFALLNKFGIFAILFSNSLAYVASYFLCNYYQYKYLNVNYRKEATYYLKLISFGLSCTLGSITIRHFIPFSIGDLIIYPFFVGISFILFVRQQKLITNVDLQLYFGYLPLVKKSLNRLLIA
ncbi:MAG TPA: oligosaccharide flippase family protein [Prolixibacteraceae bacterium]|nr:oligosaccharide flippase family protein [Prolixibacteraceae bacterium]